MRYNSFGKHLAESARGIAPGYMSFPRKKGLLELLDIRNIKKENHITSTRKITFTSFTTYSKICGYPHLNHEVLNILKKRRNQEEQDQQATDCKHSSSSSCVISDAGRAAVTASMKLQSSITPFR